MYSSPGDIFPRPTRHDVVDDPVGMATKSVRWGPTEYSSPQATPTTTPAMPATRPRAVRVGVHVLCVVIVIVVVVVCAAFYWSSDRDNKAPDHTH